MSSRISPAANDLEARDDRTILEQIFAEEDPFEASTRRSPPARRFLETPRYPRQQCVGGRGQNPPSLPYILAEFS